MAGSLLGSAELSKLTDFAGLYSHKVYTPEIILATWLSLSFFATTVSLLFYHMTRVKSIEMDARIAGAFAVLLMGVSIAYTVFAIVPYVLRLNHVITSCVKSKDCDAEQVGKLRRIRNIFSTLGAATAAIELGIAITIGVRTVKLLF